MVPKSAREVALADFSFTVTALPVLSPVPSEEALLEPQAAIENASTAAREPAAILRRLFIMFLFSTSSRRQSGESGLVCAAFARPVNPRKETMRLICPDTGAQVNCVRHHTYLSTPSINRVMSSV